MKFLTSKVIALMLVLALVLTSVMPIMAMAEESVQETSETIAVEAEAVDTEAAEENSEAPAESTEAEDTVTEETTEPETEEVPEGTTIVESAPTVYKEKTVLYVATDGNDKNAGTIDSPLATVVGARNKLREIKKSGQLGEGGAVVYVRGGTYRVTEGIIFEKEDGGTEEAPMIYRNYPGEEVEFVGGLKIDFDQFEKPSNDPVLERVIDKNAKGKIVMINLYDLGLTEIPDNVLPGPYSYMGEIPRVSGLKEPVAQGPELVVNGKGQTIARYPNAGQEDLVIGEVVRNRSFNPDVPFTIGINDQRLAYWGEAPDAILTGTFQYSWGTGSVPIGEVDTKKLRITTKWPAHHDALTDQHVWVFNLIEEIDVPGEYYIDRETGNLYYYPIEEEIKEMYLTTLADKMIDFQYSDWMVWKGIDLKYMCGRAVHFTGANDCKFIDCEVTYTGKYSFNVYGYRNQILDCWFHDVERGIELHSSAVDYTRGNLIDNDNLIENCKFERCDRVTTSYSPAIMLSAGGNKARHNEISESIHTVAQMSGSNNMYEFNEIYNACTNTDDMGAIYTGRNITHRGNIVRYNYIHDIGGANRGGNGVHGIFYDDYWSAADTVGNVFANITGAGAMAAGSYNVFDNNIFINCGESLRLTRSFDYGNPGSMDVYIQGVKDLQAYWNEEVWLEAFPEMANAIDEEGRPDINNYMVSTDNVMVNTPPTATSEEIAKTAIVERNLSYPKDPGFYDIENEIYLLNEDSQVYTDNPEFEPIPFTRMGRYSDRAINRVKDAYVYCIDSPWAIKKGEVVKSERAGAIVENGEVYLPVRCVAEAVNGEITYDEETEVIEILGNGKALSFTDGDVENVKINGVDSTLELPIINIDNVNYVSVKEFTKIFNKHYVGTKGIVVVSDIYNLFDLDADKELLRYLEEIITMY